MHVCTCITCVVSACSGEDAYLPAPGEVFDPNEDSLLAELHLATSGSNLPGEVVRGLGGEGEEGISEKEGEIVDWDEGKRNE